MATPKSLEEIPQIIIHEPYLKQMIKCPKCNEFNFVSLITLFKDKKLICNKCNKKSGLATLKPTTSIKSYLYFFFKYFAESDKKIVCSNKVYLSARIEYKKYLDELLDIIKKAKLAWKIESPIEEYINIKVCPNCGYCKNCHKLIKLKIDYNSIVCSECGKTNFKNLQVKDKECPNCSNKELKIIKKKIIKVLIDITHIRKMFYNSELTELKI